MTKKQAEQIVSILWVMLVIQSLWFGHVIGSYVSRLIFS